jgi:hypothetical protein
MPITNNRKRAELFFMVNLSLLIVEIICCLVLIGFGARFMQLLLKLPNNVPRIAEVAAYHLAARRSTAT